MIDFWNMRSKNPNSDQRTIFPCWFISYNMRGSKLIYKSEHNLVALEESNNSRFDISPSHPVQIEMAALKKAQPFKKALYFSEAEFKERQ